MKRYIFALIFSLFLHGSVLAIMNYSGNAKRENPIIEVAIINISKNELKLSVGRDKAISKKIIKKIPEKNKQITKEIPNEVLEKTKDSADIPHDQELTDQESASILNKVESKEYTVDEFNEIKSHIKNHLKYPAHARRMGIQGIVTISFTIFTSGVAKDIKIEKSSGYDFLDNAAVNAVKDSIPLPIPPFVANITVPIEFSLN